MHAVVVVQYMYENVYLDQPCTNGSAYCLLQLLLFSPSPTAIGRYVLFVIYGTTMKPGYVRTYLLCTFIRTYTSGIDVAKAHHAATVFYCLQKRTAKRVDTWAGSIPYRLI